MLAKYSLPNFLLILLFLMFGWAPQKALAGAATHFLVSAPATATAGTAISVTVTAQDAGNATDTAYAGTVHITSSDGAATLPANATLTNGVGTFSVTLKTAGTQTVTATDTVTSSINGTSANITVSAGAATIFTVTAPATATAGTAVSVTVTAKDSGNNTVTGYTGTVHFTSTDAQAVLPANTTLTNGTGTFSVALKTAGSQTVTATDTVDTTINGTTATIAVSPAATNHLAVTAPGSATAGTAFNITVTAKDAFGNTTPTYGGIVGFTSTDGAATLPGLTTLSSGVKTVSVTLKTTGNQTITATDTIIPSITGTSATITVSASAATHFTVSAPASATAGTAISVTVTAFDQFNNTAAGYGGTVHFTSTDGAAILPANAGLTNGVGTFSVTLKTSGTQTVTATDTVTPSITGTTANISVGAGAATHFTVSAPATATAGTVISATVTAKDASNNTVTGYAGTVHFTSTDSAATLPADTTLTSGTGTFSVTLKTAGGQTVTATDTVTGSITGTTANIAVSPAAANHLAVSAPATATSGTGFSITVTAQDQFNNTATAYTGTVHFTSTDGAAILPANAALTSGTGTFSVTLKTAGGQTVTATDTVAPGITGQASVTVSAGPATHLTVTASTTATAGTAITVTVTAKDASDNVATGYAGTIHFTSTDGAATLPANAGLTNGVGTFSVTLKTAGTRTVTATDTVTGSITGTTANIAVSPAAATHFTVSAPGTATAGTPISTTVTALDAFSNVVTGYSGTVHFTSTDSAATLPADTTLTNGTGTFAVTLKTAGTQTITATDTVTGSITGTSGAVTISSGAATHFVIAAPASINAGVPFSITVTARDGFNNLATSYAGTFSLTSNDPAVSTLAQNQTLTNGTGTFSAILYTTGSRTITATDTTTASITGTSAAIVVSSQGANHFSVTAPASAIAGTPVGVTVTAQDQFGNKSTGYSGTVHFTSTDGAAGLPADTTLTNGVGTLPVTFETAGTQTVTATDAVNTTFTGTSGTIVVNNVAPTIAANGISPATATAGGPQYTITVTNTDGSYITSSVVQWNGLQIPTTFVNANTLTATVSSGLIASAGSANVTVANPSPGGGVSAPALVLIDNPTPTLTSLSPSSIVRGSAAFSLTVTGTNFVSTSIVEWNGSARPTTFLSSTQLTAAIPASDIVTNGTVPVTVHTPDPNVVAGHDSMPLNFTIGAYPVPVVTSISQTSATRGDTVALTINGTNFRSGATVTIGALTPISVVFVSSTQLSATFTIGLAAATGPFPVQVTNDDGGLSNTSVGFTVNPQTVTITNLAPNSVPVDSPTQIVVVSGSGFRPDTAVNLVQQGVVVAAPPVTFVSSTQLNVSIAGSDAVAPTVDLLGKSGSYQVQAANPDGSVSPITTPDSTPIASVTFIVAPLLVSISTLTPSTATAGASSLTLSINGSGFKTGATVTVGTLVLDPSLVKVVSPNLITAQIGGSDAAAPETNLLATAKTFPVQVTNLDGSTSGALTFTVQAQLVTLTNLSPNPVQVGSSPVTLTIIGTGFQQAVSPSSATAKINPTVTVTFQQIDPSQPTLTTETVTAAISAANVSFVSAQRIDVIIDGTAINTATNTAIDPLSLAGVVNVTVTNPNTGTDPGDVGGSGTTTVINQLKVAPLGPVSGSAATVFNSGVQLFSTPYDYTGDPLGVFSNLGAVDTNGALQLLPNLASTISLIYWEPNKDAYTFTTAAPLPLTAFGDADQLSAGHAYWVRFPAGIGTAGLIRKGILAQNVTQKNAAGTEVSVLVGQSFPIALKQGWNMIGDPFTGSVLVGNLKVQFGTQSYTEANAVNLGLIGATLYSYSSTGYVPLDATKTLDPFVGYWIVAPQACTLLVPQP